MASPRTQGAAPSGYWSSRSLPIHQPEKWNGQNTVPDATRSVTSVLTLRCALVGDSTHTYSLFLTPRSFASFGLISTNISCCNSASHGFERVSSPPPSYSTSRPLVMISGYILPASLFASCTVLNNTGTRQRFLWS